MKTKTLIAALLLLNPAAFAAGPGTTTGELLKIPIGARAIGMGEAFTALADDSSALAWNPAGLALLEQKEASFMHSSLIEGVHYEHVAFAVPGETYSFGTNFSYLGYGDIAGYNDAGDSIGDQNAYSYVFSGGMARQFKDRFALGISGELLRQTLADESAGTMALNAGALYALPVHLWQANYTLGASLLHLGPGLKFVSERDPLPRKWKFGAAVTDIKQKPVNLTMDITVPNDNSPYVSLGSEYWIKDLVAMRLGYAGSNDEGRGLRVGVGIKWSGVLFDYAYGGFGDFGATHRIGLSLRFGERMKQMNADQRAILKEAKSFHRQGNYVQAILNYNEILDRDPTSDATLRQMIRSHEAMLNQELGEAIVQAPPTAVPSPEEAALSDLVPGQQAVAQNVMTPGLYDPLGLNTLPDVNTNLQSAMPPTAVQPAVGTTIKAFPDAAPVTSTQSSDPAAPVVEPDAASAPLPGETAAPAKTETIKAFPDAAPATNSPSSSPSSPVVEPGAADAPLPGEQPALDKDAPALNPNDIYGN